MDSLDSDTEMEEGLSETCSTLLGTRMVTSSGQLAGQASGVSEADCDRMKQVSSQAWPSSGTGCLNFEILTIFENLTKFSENLDIL